LSDDAGEREVRRWRFGRISRECRSNSLTLSLIRGDALGRFGIRREIALDRGLPPNFELAVNVGVQVIVSDRRRDLIHFDCPITGSYPS
jgi:hypothetical protein